VPEHYAFTDNVRDLSNQDGYQFEFECERCGNGYRSPFVHDKIAFGSKMLRAAGDLIGGNGYKLSQAAYHLDRATNSKAKDRAFSSAVETVSGEFKQCRGCGDWMCHQVCWNDEIGQCLLAGRGRGDRPGPGRRAGAADPRQGRDGRLDARAGHLAPRRRDLPLVRGEGGRRPLLLRVRHIARAGRGVPGVRVHEERGGGGVLLPVRSRLALTQPPPPA
jgi:hypothetical protein